MAGPVVTVLIVAMTASCLTVGGEALMKAVTAGRGGDSDISVVVKLIFLRTGERREGTRFSSQL